MDIWNTIIWKEWQIPNKKQKRLFPNYRKDNGFKRALRDKYLKDWSYAAHWVDSALKTAFSIMSSWKKNYRKGRRKRSCPIVRRPFVRVKQTLMKVEGDKLTSKECSRCGCVNKDLKGEKFECVDCGLIIDRQLNAAVNIYLKMEGLSHNPVMFWRWIMRPFIRSMKGREQIEGKGGFTLTGAEWKETDELARSLYDTMKPQVEVVL